MDEIYTAETLANPVKRALIANYNNPVATSSAATRISPVPARRRPTQLTPTPSPSTAASPSPSAATPRRGPSPPANPPAPISRPAPSPPSPCRPRSSTRATRCASARTRGTCPAAAPVKRLERATRLYRARRRPPSRSPAPTAAASTSRCPSAPMPESSMSPSPARCARRISPRKVFHQTTTAEWDIEKTQSRAMGGFPIGQVHDAGAAQMDLQHDRSASRPQLMVDWDKAMDAINYLMGFPLNRGKETMYCQTDVILRSSVHAPGYPAVNVSSNANSEVSPVGYAGQLSRPRSRCTRSPPPTSSSTNRATPTVSRNSAARANPTSTCSSRRC